MSSNQHLKIAMLVLVGMTLVAAPVQAETVANSGFYPQELLRNALQWVNDLGAIAPIAFILIYIVATVAFLPGSVLTLGAGVLFGIVPGSLYVFMGATIGATLAFLVGRYIARGWISQKIAGNQKFSAIDRVVGQEGFKIVFLTRLSPVFPFNLLNYALGVTGVALKDYILASVGMIPGTIMYVYIGSLAGSIATIGGETDANPVAQWAIRIIGLIATVAVTFYVTKIARKALAESIDTTDTANG
ncbi:TVP38/TMEM64 family protein [Pleurocapsa sp. CCALA 161]|uniref:TVP38/TMEM64 family protein n=1 Tax=Pleurocapsa sp. CCALA 161 TaxID=2107688 RepID=UPI000D06E6ED|nr:TVP38/TMEM64 family protein [Pleurocapsa sp. CCALA 161]PSB08900.1 TVP38/TMEM64 family protein [Pleurocapsa sp. CCALA 161]